MEGPPQPAQIFLQDWSFSSFPPIPKNRCTFLNILRSELEVPTLKILPVLVKEEGWWENVEAKVQQREEDILAGNERRRRKRREDECFVEAAKKFTPHDETPFCFYSKALSSAPPSRRT